LLPRARPPASQTDRPPQHVGHAGFVLKNGFRHREDSVGDTSECTAQSQNGPQPICAARAPTRGRGTALLRSRRVHPHGSGHNRRPGATAFGLRRRGLR
jgi:hypothetical protein